jgi:hypothetical protein
MRRLLTISLLLIPIFALMMVVALVIGRAQPPSERIERLHLTDCDPPCWNGITPKVSSRGELEQRLAITFPEYQAMGATSLPFQSWVMEKSTIDVAVDDGVVHSVAIATQLPKKSMPRLGEVLAIFGAPTCIVVDKGGTSATLYYENEAHEVVLIVSIYQRSLMSLANNFAIGIFHNLICERHMGMTWQAFRRSQRSFASTF